MKLELTKEQFKELVMASEVYSWIFGGVAEERGEDFQKYEKISDYLLEKAKEAGLKELYEDFEGTLILNEKISKKLEETIHEYNENEFWDTLVTALGKRDFWQTVTKEEEMKIKKEKWLPERVHTFYDKYWDEVNQYGVDRLKIEKD